MKPFPKVTVAVLSWNRLLYLRATLESARACIQYPNLEWIVLDNESDEPGLREYIDSLDWVDKRVFKDCTHTEAMNHVVEIAKGDYLLLWPDDVQFTVKGDWLIDMVDVMAANPMVGTITLDYQRKSTIHYLLQKPWFRNLPAILLGLRWLGLRGLRRRRVLSSERGARFFSCGWASEGLCGSGIPSLSPVKVWKKLGPWKTTSGETSIIDSSLGAEEDMIQRWKESHMPYHRLLPAVSVAADIVTDPLGCKAKVRANYRFGVYAPPIGGVFYYEIRDYQEFVSKDVNLPVGFSGGVKPIGFELPVDSSGERKKCPINLSVVYDIKAKKYLTHPLAEIVRPKGRRL